MVRHTPQLAERLVFAGLLGHAVSAALSAHTVLRAAVHSADPIAALPRLLMSLRLSLQTDWNAAASALLLAALAGFGLAKARSLSRVVVISSIAVVGAGIWLTGSRVAIVLGILATVGTLGWMMIRGSRHRFALAGGVAALVIAVGAWFIAHYPEGRNDQVGNTMRDRLVLMNAGLQMAEEAPVFGIGVDRFYESSPRYVGANERHVQVPENAHNNFIQVLAEQGLAGLLALLWLLWTVLGGGLRAQRQQPTTIRAGLLLGVAACVATWLTGHPLLVPEFTFVFWLYAAMLTALTPAPPRDRISWIAVAVIAAVLISVPARAAAHRNNANLEYRGLGVSMWHHDDTQRYRNAGGRFSLFLTATDRPIELPLRRAPGAPDPLMVAIEIDGKTVNRIAIEGDEWRTVQVIVPRGPSQFKQVDFVVDAPSASGRALPVLLRVGKETAR
jgi:O-antigen ligase